ncbi:MAG: FAD/NAD(P)-binding oxidoreductase [Dermatophilaceae bacterium]
MENTTKNLVVLGAGTAGTMVANKLRKRLPDSEWTITVVAKDDIHDYQPGYLFIPFGMNTPQQIRRSSRQFLSPDLTVVMAEVERVDAEANTVHLEGGRELPYDQLVIATGTTPRPDQTPGTEGPEFHKSVGEFYTFDGAVALRDQLARFTGGRLVVHITELPIKCPVAPLEFAFLADDYFRKRGLRDQVEIVFVTPLDGAFTKPVASKTLGHLLEEKGITVETDFMIESIDQEERVIRSYDEREIAYDQLVTVPLNMGADFVAASGLGDELNYVPVDKHTNRSTAHDNIWALGDASNIPTSKAGSVAHFSVEVFEENFMDAIAGRPLSHSFDGHANCFVESGGGKALLLDFNYDTEPLTGSFPLPKVGPMSLLKESRANHLGKLAFRHIYWNALLPGRPLGLPSEMSMAGKVPADA